jgi:hypothetical protein
MLASSNQSWLARNTSEQQSSLFATERSRLSSKQPKGQTSWFGAAHFATGAEPSSLI